MLRHLILLVILSLVALWPFARRGYFESHDGEWMVIRFTAFHQALTSGQFPVRYVERLNNNYGYPVLNFLYPLPFYLAEIPKTLGFGFVDSVKAIFVLSTVASILAMYWALAQITGKTAAVAGAIVYLFIPYRFVDLYVRGSLGENVAFAIVPIVAVCIFKLAQKKQIYAPVLSLAVGALILSHNVAALLFLPFFLVMSLIIFGKNIISVISSLILGIATATFFWLPAIYDLKFVRLSQIKVSEITDHLVDLSTLIIPSWGYGPNPNSPDGLSVQIGIVSIFIVLTTGIVVAKTKTKNYLVSYFLLIFLLITFLNTQFSRALWQNLPGVDVIQFPWRMHSVLVFITAFLVAFIVDSTKSKILLAALVVIASITSTVIYTEPSAFIDRGDNYYSTNEDTTNSRDEYLPLWVQQKPKDRAAEKIELVGPGQITQKKVKHLRYEAQVESPLETTLIVNTIYFPNFAAKVDGEPQEISYDNDAGAINVKLPSGSHKAIISYTRSPLHLASEIISLLAIFVVGTQLLLIWRKANS